MGDGQQFPELEQQLQLNASRFGTYKTKDLCDRLEALRGLSKEEFDKEAKAILNTFNGYQKTEYNTLVARTRSAKQWERFKEEADLYPNIEWLRTRSAAPRDTHLAYVGLILPQNDPFWNDNQPGNEWGCKCDWKTTDAPATALPADGSRVQPAKGLEGNPGETGELVTKEHPYYQRNTDAPKWVEDKAILRCPDKYVYTEQTTTAGNSYLEHLLVAGTQEAAANREIAALLADNGYKNIMLLPQIHKTEKTLRTRYFGAKYTVQHPAVSPDAIIDGVNVEFKSTTLRNMSRRVKEASKQANIAILKIDEAITDGYMERFIKGQWAAVDRKNLIEIVIINNGKVHHFKRP